MFVFNNGTNVVDAITHLASLTLASALPVASGGTNATSASITAFNNITGYTASGATGTTSTSLVFNTSPTLVTPVLGVASATSLAVSGFVGTATTGALTTPVGTTAQRPSPVSGMVRFNTSNTTFEGYNGSVWGSIGSGATGGGSDQVFQENQLIVTTNYTLSTGKSAMSVGPITINAGVVVTVPSGYSWAIL
jgi:hypothetical protein